MRTFQKATLLIFLLCIAMPLTAQTTFGILGGYNLTNLLLDPAVAGTSHELRSRFTFGGMVELAVTKNIALQVEPMYVQKGAHFDFVGNAVEDARREDVDLTYLEMPLMLKYKFFDRVTSPYLLAGPSFGLLLSAEQGTKVQRSDIKDQRKSYDVGLGGGFGIFLTSDRVKVFVEARYNYGFVNIIDVDNDNSKLINNGFRLLVGVLL